MQIGKENKSPLKLKIRVEPMAYRLALPPKFSKIHNVFHVSMLRRYRSNPEHVVELNLSYEEEFICILAKEVKELRNKRIPLVKVLWRNYSTNEATWERKSLMRDQYPQLFKGINFEGEIS
ncbi:receptor-like protein kinase [Gossypium australe]|uniref:Receptor-like protein kinase n=1 Tax=Gossypium australe TaxID=47621 RepID=A0A5B6WYZ6_9ROSI|nr:receptor-like protein kinase [Gossypium australe]